MTSITVALDEQSAERAEWIRENKWRTSCLLE